MTIVADRGLFVRLLVSSGKFQSGDAEALADALDSATKEPATKADLTQEITLVRNEVALLSQRVDALGSRLDTRIDAQTQRLDARIDAGNDRLLVRLGGLMFALAGLVFAAVRYTQH